MALTYQVESWSSCRKEMEPLWPLHWEEVAGDKDKITLNVWFEAYDQLEALDQLHIVTIRDDGVLVGYHWSIVRPHLHYRDSLTAFTDIYYLKESHRKGYNGIKLFKFVEKTLKEKGVQKMYTASKVSKDKSNIFELLDWKRTEVVYTKYIGD